MHVGFYSAENRGLLARARAGVGARVLRFLGILAAPGGGEGEGGRGCGNFGTLGVPGCTLRWRGQGRARVWRFCELLGILAAPGGGEGEGGARVWRFWNCLRGSQGTGLIAFKRVALGFYLVLGIRIVDALRDDRPDGAWRLPGRGACRLGLPRDKPWRLLEAGAFSCQVRIQTAVPGSEVSS